MDAAIKDTCIDPRSKKVVIYEETWSKHIVTNHVEMSNFYSEVKETIENPDKIIFGRKPQTEELYIKTFPSVDVAVSTRDLPEGITIVTTAYSDKSGKNWTSKGEEKWKK